MDMTFNNGKTDITFRDGRYYAYWQWGIQRSGTTIIERVIKDCYKVWKKNDLIVNSERLVPPAPETLTWKHSIYIPDNFPQGEPSIINYKNPYTWLESMIWRKGNANGNWHRTYGEMYKENWYWRVDTDETNGTCLPDQMLKVLKHWYNTWLPYYENNKETTVLVKYEDLLVNEKRLPLFNGIAEKFGWDLFEEMDIEWPNHVGSSAPMTAQRKEYYLNERPTQLTRGQINLVNHIMTPELIQRLGYEVL